MATYLGAEYQLLVTNMAGVPYAEIANASIDEVTWELNGWGELKWRLPTTDAQAWAELRPSYQTRREVQLWRNGVLIWWGVYLTASAGESEVTFTAYGLLWYFSRRYFGPVHSNTMPQLITNGNMESSPVTTGWTVVSATASAGTSRRRGGSQSMKLVSSAGAGTECYMGQSVSVPSPARARPLPMTVSGWLLVETLTTPHPIDNALVIGPPGSTSLKATRLEADDVKGVWLYKENTYIVPAGSTAGLSVVFYVPTSGTVYWDDARVTYQQMTGAIEGEDWSEDYLRRIVSLGAGITGGGPGAVGWGAPVNKGSLNMTYTGSGLASGPILADLMWDHADEAQIWAAMVELVARNVLDFEITWPADGRSRTVTTYPPRKGATKAGLAAELGRNITAFRYDVDGRRRTSDVRVVGRGAGEVKEEGQAGGPTVTDVPQLEDIISPAFELKGQALVDRAVTELARLSEPVRTPTITVAAGPYMGDINPGGTAEAGAPLVVGDTIPVRMDHGFVQEASNRRVVKMTLHPATETLDLVLNDG